MVAGRLVTQAIRHAGGSSTAKGLSNDELEAIEPFDTRTMHRYAPAYIAGWPAEEPSRTQEQCLALARQEAHQRITRVLGRFMPGDKHAGIRHETRLADEVIDLVLLPAGLPAAARGVSPGPDVPHLGLPARAPSGP